MLVWRRRRRRSVMGMLRGVDLTHTHTHSHTHTFSLSLSCCPSFACVISRFYLWSWIYLSSLGVLFFLSFGLVCLSVWVCICGIIPLVSTTTTITTTTLRHPSSLLCFLSYCVSFVFGWTFLRRQHLLLLLAMLDKAFSDEVFWEERCQWKWNI